MQDDENRPEGQAAAENARPRVAAALKYDAGEDAVPRVVAAGRGPLAARIEEVARASGVPVYRDPQLAWTLAGLGLDREIPPALYQVVAQIIAWVYYLEDHCPPAQSDAGGSRGRGGKTEREQ